MKKRVFNKQMLRRMMVPLLFIIIIITAMPMSGFSSTHLTREIMARFTRDTFLAVSLIIPILAGMGINFAMSLGAMAGQIGIIFAQNWGIDGAAGLFFAMAFALPIAILLGWFAGSILNRARGREMITSMILAFLISGVYQFFMLFVFGNLIPFVNRDLILSRGYGIRSSIPLATKGGFDNLWMVKFSLGGGRPLQFPLFTYLLIVLGCLFVIWFKRTKLGHDMRAIGLDQRVSASAGMNVNRIRIQAIIISTVMACFGQIIYLQNIGTMNTYNGTDQTSLFAAAAILVGGASVSGASIGNALIGVILFHLMFIIMPNAGKALTGNPAIGEYFRSFISYGVVAIALVMHAWSRSKNIQETRLQQREKTQKREIEA